MTGISLFILEKGMSGFQTTGKKEKKLGMRASDTGELIFQDAIVPQGNLSGGDFVHLAGGAIIGGGNEIGDNSMIGEGAKVIPYKKVNKNCLIGAGTIVINDIITEGTYFGVPARKISLY